MKPIKPKRPRTPAQIESEKKRSENTTVFGVRFSKKGMAQLKAIAVEKKTSVHALIQSAVAEGTGIPLEELISKTDEENEK